MGESCKNPSIAFYPTLQPTRTNSWQALAIYPADTAHTCSSPSHTLLCMRASEFQQNWAATHNLARNPLLLETLQGGNSKHGCLHTVLISTTWCLWLLYLLCLCSLYVYVDANMASLVRLHAPHSF